MLDIFTKIADLGVDKLGLNMQSHFGQAVHFFIEDTTKIFFLIYFLIFLISLFRSQLSPEKVKRTLLGKSKWYGYFVAVFLGVVTPFCSCSSIPLFMGFLAAGVPFGMSMAFLISSPLISEIAAIMLLAMDEGGVMITTIYIVTGTIISVIAGYLCDKFNLERFLSLSSLQNKEESHHCCCCQSKKEKFLALIIYAHNFAKDMIKSIAIYIFIGLIIGAVMHGYVPQEFLLQHLGKNNPWALPFAAFAGIPIYASHGSVVPIIQVLLMKGVPIGTSLVMLMSISAISLPEIVMLKRVFSYKLLAAFVGFLLIAFMISGYILNLL